MYLQFLKCITKMSFDLVAIQIYKNILQKSAGSTKTSILKTSAHKTPLFCSLRFFGFLLYNFENWKLFRNREKFSLTICFI